MAHHWSGVAGLGTKGLTLRVNVPKAPRLPSVVFHPVPNFEREGNQFLQVVVGFGWPKPIME